MKIPVKLLEKAHEEFPRDEAAVRRIRAANAAKSAVALDGAAQADRRRAMIAATAREDVADALERYIGTNDLVPFNYFLLGQQRGRPVGRIRYFDRAAGRTAMATGFLVSPDLLLTNHHVFPVADAAAFRDAFEDALVDFGFEFDPEGRRGEPVTHALDPASFLYTCKALDFALVGVARSDTSGRHGVHEHGYLVLNGQLGKAGQGDFATIIQHPDGREKQVSLRDNEIIDNTQEQVLIYRSDTAPGSSGSPVFNDEWQVIALHSAGVAQRDEQGRYIDREGQVIQPEGGRIDESRIAWVSNRGIRVSCMVENLRQAAPEVSLHPFVQALFSPAYTDRRPFAGTAGTLVPEVLPPPPPREGEAAAPSVPAMPVAFPPIHVSVSIGATALPVVNVLTGPTGVAADLAALAEEKAFEDAMNFSDCDGFQEDFLGEPVPMPTPTPALRGKLAFLRDSPSLYKLKYHHLTTIQHAVRRVPVVSAINVHGKYRYAALGKGSRQDKWFRDNRIDYDEQLNDAWYASSGFDKGHMARREDAEWGRTMERAKRAADLTCAYTNAIPQVPALNRAVFGYHGLWGTLEEKLLEAGVEGESGAGARLCVFNGPIFRDSDPVYKSVQVALECFKVVAWRDGARRLRTTCFRLSQKELVGDIDFEVLHFDQLFQVLQCPLAAIEQDTGLRFAARLHETDTAAGATHPFDEVKLQELVAGAAHE